MAKVCDLTGKKPLRGNNVSHSNKKTRRYFKPNLHDKKFYVPEEDVWVKLRVSAKAMKTIDKIGIMEYLKREGYELDI